MTHPSNRAGWAAHYAAVRSRINADRGVVDPEERPAPRAVAVAIPQEPATDGRPRPHPAPRRIVSTAAEVFGVPEADIKTPLMLTSLEIQARRVVAYVGTRLAGRSLCEMGEILGRRTPDAVDVLAVRVGRLLAEQDADCVAAVKALREALGL